MRSPINNNPMVQSPVLLQPQNLHHLTRGQNDSSTFEVVKPRSYSASSEMLLNNFHHHQQQQQQQQLQQPQLKFNQNTRALVGKS